MARKTSKELTEICNKFGIDTLWSWSRYHCYKQDRWEYFLKYILHKKEDRTNSIYCVSGGNVHDIIEQLYTGKIKYEDMPDLYEDSSSGDNTEISWQHVQTVLTSSQYSKHITVPDIRRNSRIEGASVFNTYDFIEFIDSVGASFWGIESPMQLNEDVTYWIEATCEKDETNGKYNISITYGNDLDPSGTWNSQQIAHDYPLARIAVPKASKIKPFRIYQELPNI